MIYDIILEDSSKIPNAFDYLEKNGDFLIDKNKLVFHTENSKAKLSRDFKKIYGKDFGVIIKPITPNNIIHYTPIVYSWYAKDVATLKEEEINKYQQEALSILNEIADKIITEERGEETIE